MKDLEEVRRAFSLGNIPRLRRLSRKFSRRAAEEDDPFLAKLAVLSYALAKILQKEGFSERVGEILSHLGSADEGISYLETLPSRFVTDLIRKAKVKIAARIHGHGLSVKAATQMVGAPLPDVQDYVGKTKISERVPSNKTVKKRLREAEADILGGS